MDSPTRFYRSFVDADGVCWGVETRLLGQGADAIAVGFAFTSQRGEHRTLHGSPPECLSCEQFGDDDWRALLVASRLVRPASRRSARVRYSAMRNAGRA